VGSKLELKLGSQPVQVITAIGSSHEIVELYAWTTEKLETSTTPVLDYGIRNNTKGDASIIWTSLEEHAKNNATPTTPATTTLPSAPDNKISKILAIVPSRYFSFDIETGGGAVYLAASKEASIVSVKTHGGAITGGSLQASSIYLESHGGAIAMKQLTASELDIKSNGGGISIRTLAGLSMKVDGSGGSSAAAAPAAAVRIGACFVEKKAEFVCGTFTAESLRGGTDDSGSIYVKLVPNTARFKTDSTGTGGAQNLTNLGATVGGVDGALNISSNQGPATIDLQINEGCRDVMVDTSSVGNAPAAPSASTINLHVAPTLAAHVVLSECGKDWMLPADTHVVLGEETSRNVYAQLDIEDGEQLGPRSRLQRGSIDNFGGQTGAGATPCTVAVQGAGRVRVERRSWMQARQEIFRLKQT